MRRVFAPSPVQHAAVFRESDGPAASGILRIDGDSFSLEGRRAGRLVALTVALADVREVRVGRAPVERLNGQPTLVVTRRAGPVLFVQPFGAGLLSELADLLSTLAARRADDLEWVEVRVPLKPGCLERARELISRGPPFEPAALRLQQHDVFLREGEAVFVLRGPHVHEALERAMREPGFWRSGLAWRSCVAGRPRIVQMTAGVLPEHELVYSWTDAGLDPDEGETVR
jgi:hypothetical protein